MTILLFLALNLGFTQEEQAGSTAGEAQPQTQTLASGNQGVFSASVCNNKTGEDKTMCDRLELAKLRREAGCMPSNDIRKHINTACRYIKTRNCEDTLKACARSARSKSCAQIPNIDKETAREALKEAKDDFEDSEDKLQDLQKDLQQAQEDALKQQQSTEEQISQLQEELNQIPIKANELALKNEVERDKTLLDHIDNMNSLTDQLQEVTDQIHDAETELTNKRNELLSQCELEARGKQQAKIADKNQKKATGSYTVKSLSHALNTSYVTNSNGKRVLRNTKEIIERFERCQKTRMYQVGIQAAERSFQRNLIGLEARRKTLEKRHNSLNARLESSLKLNAKAAELEMASLAREQSAKSQKVLMLQKQMMESQQQAQANIQQIQQNLQKAQLDQAQKQQSMFSALQLDMFAKNTGIKDEETADSIREAMRYFRNKDSEGDFEADEQADLCS